MSSTGYLVIDEGIPQMSIYHFEKIHPRELRRIYAGDKSLKFILEDSHDKQSRIELHSRVPQEEFNRRFPDSKLGDLSEFEALLKKKISTKKKSALRKISHDFKQSYQH